MAKKKKKSVARPVVYDYNPNTESAETGEPWVLEQPGLHRKMLKKRIWTMEYRLSIYNPSVWEEKGDCVLEGHYMVRTCLNPIPQNKNK